MRSAVYEGTLWHRRHGEPGHAFRRAVALPWLDLDELPAVAACHPLWSVERRNVVSHRRADFLGDPAVPLAEAVRGLVEQRTGRRPPGPVTVLANLRTWGWLFNPITIYACGAPAEALVLEVTNTPWHERHTYVLDGGAGEHRFAKELHVSPFLPMDLTYRLRLREPGSHLSLQLACLDGERPVFEAALAGRRLEIDRASLGRVLWRHPLGTHRVSAGIYRQAAALRRKGATFHPHPGKRVTR